MRRIGTGLKRWIACAGGSLALVCGAAGKLDAQLTFRALEARWLAGGDGALLDDLERYWAEKPDGRRWEIPFMAAIERCERGDAANVALGRRVLRSLPLKYDRTGPGQRRLKAAADLAAQCQVKPPRTAVAQVYAAAPEIREIAGIAYSNKVYWEGCRAHANGGRQVLGALSPGPRLRAYPAADSLTARPWARDLVQGALGGFARRDWPVVSGRRVGRFLFTSWSKRDRQGDFQVIGDSLEFARAFFDRQFGLAAGDTLFSVYLVPEESVMRDVSLKLHGIPDVFHLIGYSVDLDQSIVAIVPGVTHGTIKHELVHLLMHRSFPDAPAWLDEGLAALYEVSARRGDRLVGLPNWRGTVLRAYRRPPLHEILAMSPDVFNGQNIVNPETAFARQSLHHAMARYFMLYLQEQGMLGDIVRGMAREPLFVPTGVDATVTPQSSPVRRMSAFVRGRASTRVTNAIDADFARWLSGVLPVSGPNACAAADEG